MSDATVTTRAGANRSMGLECWALGTPAELDALTTALASVGAIAWQGTGGTPGRRDRLSGGDAGRWRAYLRVSVRSAGGAS